MKPKLKSRFLSILFWSVISAAFIGPGTVTTAAGAGASYGYSLLWALAFSTIATIILQEAAARITVVSGMNLGEAIRKQYSTGSTRQVMIWLVIGAIIFGSAAYEAGNILGAVAGLQLSWPLSKFFYTLLIGIIASLLLWFGTIKLVANVLGMLVTLMGFLFLCTAFLIRPQVPDVLGGTFLPSFPAGSGLLILALVGTTVVPYNLFLGSGIATGQNLRELRFDLSVAVILGGIISMAILIVGASLTGNFTYHSLASTLTGRFGAWTGSFFGIGLFAAGLSSAITAPLASAITARSLFADKSRTRWHEKSARFRFIWGIVMLTGLLFGFSGIKPIPAIIVAQALNGIVLPFAAIILLIAVNDSMLMGRQYLNGIFSNVLTGIVVFITIILGTVNILKAVAKTVHYSPLPDSTLLITGTVIALIISLPLILLVRKKRSISAN